MTQITIDSFQNWLEMYCRASQENNPKDSADLFTQNALYYESPFSRRMVGREAIYKYWDDSTRNLKDKKSGYEVLAVQGSQGIANWWAQFFNVNTAQIVILDCIFIVEFDENQKCRLFREWWHSKTLETDRNTVPSVSG